MRPIWLLVYSRLLLAPLVALLSANAARAASGPAGVFNVLDHGAKGDGVSPDTAAIQRAVDACAAAGGGQVVLPAGRTYLAGAITLRSGVGFHLPRGAVLKMSDNWRDYGHEGALLFAKDAPAAWGNRPDPPGCAPGTGREKNVTQFQVGDLSATLAERQGVMRSTD